MSKDLFNFTETKKDLRQKESRMKNNKVAKLIPIMKQVIGNEEVNAVNARDLHKALESGKDFSNWIKHRIEKLKLKQGMDFEVFNQMGENLNGGRPLIEYIITTDIAKHLCMIEMTDRGHKVREYFIECEKQLRETSQFKLPQTYKEALIQLVAQVELNEKLELENKQKQEIIEYQSDKLDSYKEIEKSRRSKAEIKSKFNKYVRLLAEQSFNRDYPKAYCYIYSIFRSKHNFTDTDKIDMKFLDKNIDYLQECLEIVLSEID